MTTYNAPDWLEKVLWGYSCQSAGELEIVIADDGSGEDTAHVIRRMREETGTNIVHVRHEDEGFRKCAIVNKAIERARSDYLLFTDGDCIPRKDFVLTHLRFAREGHFLSGGYYKLPDRLSSAIEKDDILSGKAFQPGWLFAKGLRNSPKALRLAIPPVLSRTFDHMTTTRATFNGCNTSAWKKDILRVNGFDERMQYGGLDRELGERLVNAGVKPIQLRHSAVCLHLHHKRCYADPALIAENRKIREITRGQKLTWTAWGIIK